MKKRNLLYFLLSVNIVLISCKLSNHQIIVEDTNIEKKNLNNDVENHWIQLKNGTATIGKLTSSGYSREKNIIYDGKVTCGLELKSADAKTFEYLLNTDYARDNNHVYYVYGNETVETKCGTRYYTKQSIPNVHPKSFIYLGKGYATDGSKAFFRGVLIKDADGNSFEVIHGPEYFYFAKDKNNVYMHNTIFKGADPLTFYYDEHDRRNSLETHQYIIGDQYKKWSYNSPNRIESISKE